jgi:two-component system sensor histidine kinase RegB
MGLGFFIAKTLLERSGALVALENRQAPTSGAIAKVSWPRQVFENLPTSGEATLDRRSELTRSGQDRRG